MPPGQEGCSQAQHPESPFLPARLSSLQSSLSLCDACYAWTFVTQSGGTHCLLRVPPLNVHLSMNLQPSHFRHCKPAMETLQRCTLLCPSPLRGQHVFRTPPRLQTKHTAFRHQPFRHRRCPQRHSNKQHIRCAASPLDLAWGTSINVDAQVTCTCHTT